MTDPSSHPSRTYNKQANVPSCSLSLRDQTTALRAQQTPWRVDTRRIFPAGKAVKQAALNSCTQLLISRCFCSFCIAQGNRHTVLCVMSALKCPCQSKGGGVLHNPSCWLSCLVERCHFLEKTHKKTKKKWIC